MSEGSVMMTQTDVRAKALEVYHLLTERYGERPLKPRRQPMHELISILGRLLDARSLRIDGRRHLLQRRLAAAGHDATDDIGPDHAARRADGAPDALDTACRVCLHQPAPRRGLGLRWRRMAAARRGSGARRPPRRDAGAIDARQLHDAGTRIGMDLSEWGLAAARLSGRLTTRDHDIDRCR